MSLIKNLSVDPKELFDYFIKSKGAKEVIFFGPYYLNSTGKPKETSRTVVFSKYEQDKNKKLNKVLASKRSVDAMISVRMDLLNIRKTKQQPLSGESSVQVEARQRDKKFE